jgi:hypothetical protein
MTRCALTLAIAAISLTVVGFTGSAVSAPGRTAAFHATKDCSGFDGTTGYCTFRSSNVKALKAGAKLFYLQKGGKSSLDSDIVIYVGPGTVATGHCFLRYVTGIGLCTVSDGTGNLAGFHLRVRVKADTSVPELWHWDGSYGFSDSSSGHRAGRTRVFHLTKACTGTTASVGFHCTTRSSNVKELRAGSRIYYFQAETTTVLDSDIAVYAGRGDVATGHCVLPDATSIGVCTISDGTGTLTGLHARVRVTPDRSNPELFHWDGTYRFDRS